MEQDNQIEDVETVHGSRQYAVPRHTSKACKEYNNTKHSSIKMTPVEASKKKNERLVYYDLYGDMERTSSKPKFKVGEKVRISKYKRKVFEKGYTPNWTEEVFLVDAIQYTNPKTYRLRDLNDEEIKGCFYEPELSKAKHETFRIENVIRRDYKNRRALVKWKGYSDKFNIGYQRAAFRKNRRVGGQNRKFEIGHISTIGRQ